MGLLLKFAIGALIVFVVLASAGLLFSARPTPLIGVNGDALAHSVDETQSTCGQRPDGDWNCLISDGPRPAKFRVKVGWDGCWEATRGTTDRTGCVDIWDHLQLEEILN